jgi:hypothetical protein
VNAIFIHLRKIQRRAREKSTFSLLAVAKKYEKRYNILKNIDLPGKPFKHAKWINDQENNSANKTNNAHPHADMIFFDHTAFIGKYSQRS